MRLFPILAAVLLLGTVGCRSKSQDGAGASAGASNTSSQDVPDESESGGEGGAEPSTTTADSVKISGAVQVPDDDLTPISPASSTLHLSEETTFAVTCNTLANKSTSCTAPVMAKDNHNGVFTLDCPGAGADTLACYLVKGSRRDTILFDELPILTVGNGTLVLNISTAGNGVPVATVDKEQSSALANVDADLAAAKAEVTALVSYTGNWQLECLESGQAFEANSGDENYCYNGGVKYYADFTSTTGKRTVTEVDSPATYDLCFDAATNKPTFGVHPPGGSIRIDYQTTATFLRDVDAFYASVPSSIFSAQKLWMDRLGSWSTEVSYCQRHPAHALCQIIPSGLYAGMTGVQRDAFISEFTDFWRFHDVSSDNRDADLETFCSEAASLDFSHCLVAGNESSTFCVNVKEVSNALALDMVGQDLVVANLDRTFAECVDGGAGHAYQTFCNATFGVMGHLDMAIDTSGRMVPRPEGDEGPLYSGYYPWQLCAFADWNDDCATSFASKAKEEQQLLIKQAVELSMYISTFSICPSAASAASYDATACRAEFLAEIKATQRDRILWLGFSAFETALCADVAFGKTLVAAPACFPEATYFNDCSSGECLIDRKIQCFGSENDLCIGDDGTFQGRLASRDLKVFDVKLGVNGALSFSHNEIYESFKFDDDTQELKKCNYVSQSIRNGTLLGADEFTFENQQLFGGSCMDSPPVDNGTESMKATRLKVE